MKRLLFIAGLAIISFVQVNAQVAIKPGVGLNFTNFSKNPTTGEFSAKGGWHAGGTIAFGKKVYFEPGLFYTSKTTEFQTSGGNATSTDIKLEGFRVPVGVGINILGNEKSIFDIHAFGGASAFFVTNDGGVPQTVELNKTNFGVFAGGGVDIWKIFIDVSYELSVSNIQKNVNTIDWGKSRGFFATAGLRLNF